MKSRGCAGCRPSLRRIRRQCVHPASLTESAGWSAEPCLAAAEARASSHRIGPANTLRVLAQLIERRAPRVHRHITEVLLDAQELVVLSQAIRTRQ